METAIKPSTAIVEDLDNQILFCDETIETASQRMNALNYDGDEFDPFAFRVNDYGLPEIASGYVFTEPGKKAKDPYPYKELTEEQHREALGVVFVNGPIKGCRNFEAALKSGYATCGKVGAD